MFSNTESGRELLANKARSDAKEAAPSEEAANASKRAARSSEVGASTAS